MNKYILNDLSLHGQFDSIEDFLLENKGVIACIRWANKRGYRIYKKSDFFNAKVIGDKTLYQCLSGRYRPTNGEGSDLLRKYKLLLELMNGNPFWDIDLEYNTNKCLVNECDMSCTSVAAAIQIKGALFSFVKSEYTDKNLEVMYNGECMKLYSISSPYMYSQYLMGNSYRFIDELFKLRYNDTILNFSKLDEKYGFSEFEKREIGDCINTFDRFIKMSWEQIHNDSSFHFKEYSPSSSTKDWFIHSEYRGCKIHKFRCVNPKRCYGYREGDVFYVLRMERDHSISDFG